MGWLAANGSRLAGGLVVAYLFVPVVVIVAFSLNSPEGKFNFVWKRIEPDTVRIAGCAGEPVPAAITVSVAPAIVSKPRSK
jgi:ABC-type spermidine/putrescine transport system permease subunit II